MINDLIKYVASINMSNTVYNGFLILCFVGWFVFNLMTGRKYGLPIWKRLTVSLIVWPLAYALLYVLYWIECGFSDFGGHYNIVRGFIYFPLIALALGKIIKIPFRTVSDYIAPGVSLCQGIAHIGCSFAGCCHGFPAPEWFPDALRIWNPEINAYLIPNQMAETFAALAVFLICALYAKKTGYNSSGKVYPLFLILFGVTRFLLEFLRDNEKIVGNFSTLAPHALLMVAVGIVWMTVNIFKDKRKKATL